MLIKGKTAVLTGSNRGIGKKILEIFSANGANIFACLRSNSKESMEYIQGLMNKYNNKIIPIEFDLDNEQKLKESTKQILDYNIPIDIIVNNAGIITTSLFQMTSLKKLKEIFETNFFSQTVFTQYLIKSMIKIKKGSIIYISTNAAIEGFEGRSAYAASKAALLAQSKVLSRELGIYNIRVNSIAPGLTNTDMMKQNHSEELINESIKNIPLKRVCEPSEIANVALFLASDLSSYITGQTLKVDGGI